MTELLRTYEGRPWCDNAYCPRCNCRKSNTECEPNGIDEGCETGVCLCHEEDVVVK